MAKDVDVTFEDMRREAKTLTREKAKIDSTLKDLEKKILGLLEDGFVTRKASKKFGEDFDQFKQGMEKTNEGLEGLSQYLNKAAESFERIDDDLAKGGK